MDKFAPVPRPEEIRQMIAKLEEAEATCGGCFITPWKFNSEFSPEKLPGPKRKGSSSNHHFSGASC